MSAGRLENERRFDILIRAIPQVRQRHPRCRFIIVGSGSSEEELKSLARDLRVDDAITWTGWLPSIYPMLSRSHVYVNTWPWEGFGMATAEAMAYEIPVIAAKSGASPELVQDGVTGLLVPPEDPAALAGAISQLVGDRVRATTMGQHGRERADMRYSVRQTAISTLEFYREVEQSGESV
jgi:glycosyltransferase involved in cell wall biosynthesis